jgi:hypothetical protein
MSFVFRHSNAVELHDACLLYRERSVSRHRCRDRGPTQFSVLPGAELPTLLSLDVQVQASTESMRWPTR